MNLKKINGTYKCFYKGAGNKTHQVDTKQSNIKDAKDVVSKAGIEKLEKAAVANALTEQVVSTLLDRPKTPCAKLVRPWLTSLDERGRSPNTLHDYGASVKAWLKGCKLADALPLKIERGHVDAFVNPDGDLTRSGRSSRLAAVSGFCDWLRMNRHISEDPSMGVKVKLRGLNHLQKEGRKRQPFTEGEYKVFMQYLDLFLINPDRKHSEDNARFWQSAIPLAYWTGLRLSDICNLEWNSVGNGELVVWTQKRESRVALPLDDPLIGSGELKDVLSDLNRISIHERYVFPHYRAISEDPAGRSFFSKDFPRWRDSAGLGGTGKTFHCLRHAFVTRLKRAGKSIEEIGRLVGHKDSKTTKRYAH